jgi:hypothetical protein
MIPTAFQVSVTGDGQSPVPVKITVGPGVVFICLLFVVVLLLKGRKK